MLRKLGLLAVCAIVLISVVFTNCDHVRLTLDQQVSEASLNVTQLCTSVPAPAGVQTRVLFLIDMSASNVLGNPDNRIPTDPQKLYRYGSMKTFVDEHIGNGNISYGLIVFSGTTASALVDSNNDPTQPIFTNDGPTIYGALQTFLGMTDAGDTPYKAALTLAETAIANDLKIENAAGVNTIYSVVMITDGFPTDYGYPVNDTALDTDLQTLLSITTTTRFSDIYYGPEADQDDLNAVIQLQAMAKLGSGNFLDTNLNGRAIAIDQVIAYAGTEPWAVKQFMVTNLNAGVCDDGSIDVDSDADGLCDKDELSYNQPSQMTAAMQGMKFDPTQRNSFGNQYNDYINYRSFAYGESLDTACAGGTTRTGVDLLNDCEKVFVHSQSPVGPTPTWTAAMGLHADKYNYDSDGDGFLDFIEFTFGRSISAALDYNSPMQSVGSYSMRDILLGHLHPLNPAAAIPYQPNLQFVGQNQFGSSCYTYNQQNIPLYNTLPLAVAGTPGSPELVHAAGQNVFLVYYIETPQSDPYGVGQLFYRYVYIDYGSNPSPDIFINGSFLNYTPTLALVNRNGN